ncbi:MAG: radical SAM family heme chaperone HemW [Gammaproteobacteria bacterium]|jgi:oxygen-independent coproporphyrinogen-3 oxidase
MLNLKTPPPLSLYVHIPWCVKKCPYCDFNSHPLRDTIDENRYLEALLRDLEQGLERIWGRRVVSVFIGGGTPSTMSPDFYDQLLSALRARLMLNADAEITLEANPGTVDMERFQGFRAAGINRLSIGVQSFNDTQLQQLGRIHSGNEAQAALEAARAAGFDNINLDLMYGLPGQTRDDAIQDIKRALQLAPEHLSYYQLTIEPNTLFASQPPALPDDDERWDMQVQAQQLIGEQDYHQYEVSAYAKPGRQCMHNRNYWEFGDYLGIGAGAHSKLTDVNAQSVVRLAREKHPRDYMTKALEASPLIEEKTLSRGDLPLEFMMNALRLSEGFSTQMFEERIGLPITVAGDALQQAEQKELIQWDIHTIKPTERGFRFLDDLVAMFLPDQGRNC